MTEIVEDELPSFSSAKPSLPCCSMQSCCRSSWQYCVSYTSFLPAYDSASSCASCRRFSHRIYRRSSFVSTLRRQ